MPEKPSLVDRLLGPSLDDAGEELAEGLRRPGVRKRAALIVVVALLMATVMLFALNPAWALALWNAPDLHVSFDRPAESGGGSTKAPTSAPTPALLTPIVSEDQGIELEGNTSVSSETTALVTSPSDGDLVPELSRFEGIYSGVPADGCLWLFIDSPWNSLLFPQGPLWTRTDGTFDRIVAIGSGNDDDHLKEFVVNVGWIPQTTCDLWSATGEPVGTPIEAAEVGDDPQFALPPIKELPPSTVLYSSVRVVLDRNLESSVPTNEDGAEIK